MSAPRCIVGIDACRSGWIACFLAEDLAGLSVRTFLRIEDVLAAPEAPALLAVDMPIGLPDRIAGSGRGPEMAVRPLLGARQSSVFSVPSRAAVMASDYAASCATARETSDPPRKVSKQCFMLFPRIREIDALLVARPDLRARIFETHPEVCFYEMNGRRPLSLPKKIKSRPNPPGLAERANLLLSSDVPCAFLDLMMKPPRGSGGDDVLDAVACAWTARRILHGEASVYPDPPPRDAHGLEMAIRA